MIVSSVFPGSVERIDLDDPAGRERLLDLYAPPRPEWLRVNLIQTVSGSAGGSDGTSETITNPVDRTILGVIRELADVVLIGAQSMRAEGYVLPRRSALAVVTMSGDLSGHGIEAPGEPGRLFVLCPASAAARVRESLGEVNAQLVVLDDHDGSIPAPAIVAALRSLGLATIVCEGGPSLVAQLLAARCIDELCLSTSPIVGGAIIPAFGSGLVTESRLTLTRLLVDESSSIYARWLTEAGLATQR